MSKLNLPPARNRKDLKGLEFNGIQIKTGVPENHIGTSQVLEQLRKGIREGAFKGLENKKDERPPRT